MSIKEILTTMEYGPAPEGAEVVNAWLEGHNRKFGLFIGGSWREASHHFPSNNPANGAEIAQVAQASNAEVDEAVNAARAALGPWQALGCAGRAKVLYALARAVQKHTRHLAVLESMDNGKPIRETRDIDVPLVARHFYHHAGWAQLLESEFPEYEAVGVCGQIIPWNFPLLMLSWKIAPALAAGNTVILKPAEFTSLTALRFAELCTEAGVPPGVVNIITGDGETGRCIVEHPGIDKIAFTGSTEVGRILRTATAGTGKKLSLELGGKSPFIVFEDADHDGAIEGLVDAIWFNQGQVCCAGSRLLVQEGIATRFIEKLKARMATLRVGDPLDKAVDVGAVVDPIQRQRIDELVQQGVAEGAELYQVSECPTVGCFYPPTLLTNVGPASTVAQVEIFGPVLVAMTFRTPDEAIALANNTVYGLASSIWTENLNVAHDMAARVKAGSVWVNCTNQFDAASGFGGYKESGFGREGGKEGMYEYLRPRPATVSAPALATTNPGEAPQGEMDRTHKLYIAGKQARPDGGYSLIYETAHGPVAVSRGNRKDLRNAVESAESTACAWASQTSHARAQILYYLGENLSAARDQMVNALTALGASAEDAHREMDASIERCMWYAAWADKNDGKVHCVPMRALVYTRNEPIGSCAVICPPESPLLGFLSTVLPLLSQGNTVVAVPSVYNPLPACELIRVIEASDVPAGVLNIVTGTHAELVKTLAEHEAIQAIWHFGDAEGGTAIEKLSAANLKQTWCSLGKPVDWYARPSREFLRRSVQVKNIWTPYGA
ncbi:MAG: aldehyde dehydrogenase family protein [Chthonomonas sp.]|nr:aldehyde dehydrogenase family protein [Chthonomonas sp.]